MDRKAEIKREIDALFYAMPDDMDERIDALEAEMKRLGGRLCAFCAEWFVSAKAYHAHTC